MYIDQVVANLFILSLNRFVAYLWLLCTRYREGMLPASRGARRLQGHDGLPVSEAHDDTHTITIPAAALKQAYTL